MFSKLAECFQSALYRPRLLRVAVRPLPMGRDIQKSATGLVFEDLPNFHHQPSRHWLGPRSSACQSGEGESG
jgi:hypothetical protein